MISYIKIITILFLIVLIIILLTLVFGNRITEGFHPVFDNDSKLKLIINKLNEEKSKASLKNTKENLEIQQSKKLDEIEKEINKFDNVLNVIKENINHIPICREIDLKYRAAPNCSLRNGSECTINPFCKLEFDKNTGNSFNKVCVNKQLKKECEDIFEYDENNNLTGKAKKFFVYPSILDEVKVL